jgi:hypothetical protein
MPRIANIGRKSAASVTSTSISSGSRPYRWTWMRSRSAAGATRVRSMRICRVCSASASPPGRTRSGFVSSCVALAPDGADATSRRGADPPTRSSWPDRCRQSSRYSPSACGPRSGTVPSRRLTTNIAPSLSTMASVRFTAGPAATSAGIVDGGWSSTLFTGLLTASPRRRRPTHERESPADGRSPRLGVRRREQHTAEGRRYEGRDRWPGPGEGSIMFFGSRGQRPRINRTRE